MGTTVLVLGTPARDQRYQRHRIRPGSFSLGGHGYLLKSELVLDRLKEQLQISPSFQVPPKICSFSLHLGFCCARSDSCIDVSELHLKKRYSFSGSTRPKTYDLDCLPYSHLLIGYNVEGVFLGRNLLQPAPGVQFQGTPGMPVALLIVVHNTLALQHEPSFRPSRHAWCNRQTSNGNENRTTSKQKRSIKENQGQTIEKYACQDT